MLKMTTAFKDLPIGSKFMRLGEYKILMKVSGIIKDDVELNCLDIDKGCIYNMSPADEVLWINVQSIQEI